MSGAEAIIHEDYSVFDECEEIEEVLFVSCDQCSVSCQTQEEQLQCPSTRLPPWPGIPIFFCAQPSPTTATTQCHIPCTAEVGVGTQATRQHSAGVQGGEQESPGSLHRQVVTGPPPAHLLQAGDGGHNNKQALAFREDSAVLSSRTTTQGHHHSEKSADAKVTLATDTLLSSVVKEEINTLVPKRKRGRKKNTVQTAVCERWKHSNGAGGGAGGDAGLLGKRKRRRKQDADFEYDMAGSGEEEEEERKCKVEFEDDTRDEDWRGEGEILSDEELDVKIEEVEVQWSEGEDGGEGRLPRSGVREEGSSKDLGFKIFVDSVVEDTEDSEDGDSAEVKDGRDCRVLTVGVPDLGTGKRSSQTRKYAERARERYRREKVIKEDGRVMYQCLKCDMEWPTRLQLQEHRRTHSARDHTYKCMHCNKEFTDAKKYFTHLAFHGRLFTCSPCGRRFSLLANLKKHLQSHPGALGQVCEVCGGQFRTLEGLVAHHQLQHPQDNIRPYKVRCGHCGKRYVRQEAYEQHVSNAPYQCSLCEASLGCEARLNTHIRYQHGQLVCEYCGKSFKKNSLLHHIKIMHREAQVKCPHCPKKFTYRSKMLAHMDANHCNEKKYRCNRCPYTARTVNTLNLHVRRTHRDPGQVRRYPCSLCDRKFFLPSKLTLHYRTHTGEKPFKCTGCGKGFASKHNMRDHERCVHGERVQVRLPDGSTAERLVKRRRVSRAPARPRATPSVLPASPSTDGNQGTGVQGQAGGQDKGEALFEVVDGAEQDLMVSIPEYATHVEIDGIEYQVVRQ